jgi:hypothetical protein
MSIIRSGKFRLGPRHINQGWVVGRDDRATPARWRGGSRLAFIFASAPGRGGGTESELLKADIDSPPHLALPLTLRLARSLTPGRTQIVASRSTRLRCMRLVRVFTLERLPQTLQFENQRGALQPDAVALRLAGPAPRGPTLMPCTVSRSHD